MRKIIVSNVVSLDGFFEGVHQEIDWFTVDESFFEYARQLLNEADTILFGRVTYEMMAAFWPNAIDEDAVITHKMNHLSKIVFSTTLKKVEWNNAKLVKGNLSKEVKNLKEQPGKDIVIFGSGTLVNQLTQLGLIDEYRMIVNPLILGKGNPMFKGMDEKINLKLLDTKVLKSGVVILYYKIKRLQKS